MIKETVFALVNLANLRVRNEITRRPKELIENITQRIENIETEGIRKH